MKTSALALSMCVLVAGTVSASLTGYRDAENLIPVAEKTLKYFDKESDWSTPALSPAPIPNGIDSLLVGGTGAAGDLVIDKNTKVNGIFSRASDDGALKLAGTGGTSTAREFTASLLRVNYAKGDQAPTGGNPEYANFTSGTVTAYFDIATTTYENSGLYKGVRSTFFANSNSGQYSVLLNFGADGNIEVLNEGEGDVATYTVPYETNKWYTVAVEIGGNSLFYNAWIDGTKVTLAEEYGNRMQRNQVMTAFRDLYVGMQVAPNVQNDLYVDNMAVYFDEPYSAERYSVIKDAAAISLNRDILGDNASADTVTTNLTLPTVGEYGSTIVWESSKPNVIATDGTVARVDEATPVTLTATVTNGGKTETKSFDLVVPKFLGYEEEAIATDKAALTFDAIKGKNMYEGAVLSNLTLPTMGANGSTITWASSNEAVVASDGRVTRKSEMSQWVSLTATLKNGEGDAEETATREFLLNVLGDTLLHDPIETVDTCYSKMREHSDGLTFSRDNNWGVYGVKGVRCQEIGQTGQYVVYDAMPGADFTALIARYSGAAEFTFATAGEDKAWKSFTSVQKETGVDIGANEGGWNAWVYTSTAPLPAGTRYLRINIGAGNSRVGAALLSKVDITGYGGHYGNDITMSRVLGANTSANEVTTDLDIYPMWGVEWQSSNPDVIASNGAVTRPAEDTVVTMTANIDTPDMTATKTFTLTVKAE